MTARLAFPILAAAALGLAACGGKSDSGGAAASAGSAGAAGAGKTNAASTYAQMPPAMQDLLDCAGAYAAVAGINPDDRHPDIHRPGFTRYMRVFSKAIDMTGSASGAEAGTGVEERAAFWKAQPGPAQQARAAACDAKYPAAS
jgi:hypothetical protein